MRIILAVIALAVMALTGCNPNNSNSNSNTNTTNSNTATNTGPAFQTPEPIKPASAVDPNFQPCNPYYPLVPGSTTKYTINFSSGLVGNVTVVVDRVEEDGKTVFVETTQIIDASGGLQKAEKTVRKYVCDGERVQIIYQKSDNRVVERSDIFETKFKGTAVAMVESKALNTKGTTWSYSFTQARVMPGEPPVNIDEPVVITFTAQGEEEVTVPAGKFKAIKILRKVGATDITEHYAPGIGMVKRASSEGTGWVLKEYGGLKPVD